MHAAVEGAPPPCAPVCCKQSDLHMVCVLAVLLSKLITSQYVAVYIWAEGARYEGEYKEDKKNGRGVQTWPSGARLRFSVSTQFPVFVNLARVWVGDVLRPRQV